MLDIDNPEAAEKIIVFVISHIVFPLFVTSQHHWP